MTSDRASRLTEILQTREADLLTNWLQAQTRSDTIRSNRMDVSELRDLCREFLNLLRDAAQQGLTDNLHGAQWDRLRDMLASLSRSWAQQGFTPTQTATFVFSFKQPLFDILRAEMGQNSDALFEELWAATNLLDQLGLYTTEVFQAVREETIQRQQEDMLELSTPVVKLWDGILALPMIGTLDSNRTQIVMESLLQRIVDTGADIAILDITGVPTVDTLVAQHLLKTVAAARLMGADCIISGIRPQIAQTIVHLGVDLSAVVTKATLADAFSLALQRRGVEIKKK